METFDKDMLKVGKFSDHGAVYEGEYKGQKVAVEALDFTNMNRSNEEKLLRKEASLWSELDHPNIAKFIGSATELTQEGENKYWCIMVSEFLEGGLLSEYLYDNRKKRLPLKRVLELALDAAKGLAYLHSKKIIHRNVNSRNMELDGHDRLKVVDFRLSRKEGSNPWEPRASTGTNDYMAPEVQRCEPYDHKCDVFSFGICLWEMFHCQPVEITTPGSFRPKVNSDCPDVLMNLMLQCWYNKEGRPEMSQVVKTLEDILEEILEEEAKRRKNFKGCFGLFRRS